MLAAQSDGASFILLSFMTSSASSLSSSSTLFLICNAIPRKCEQVQQQERQVTALQNHGRNPLFRRNF